MSHTVVGTIKSIETGVAPAGDVGQIASQDVRVRFSDDREVRLDPAHPLASTYVEVLEHLRQDARPVCLAVDDGERIEQLWIPHVARVASLRRVESGDVLVRLEPSHGVHRLKATEPRYDELLRELAAAQGSDRFVAVTETPDQHEIFDVRPTATPFFMALPTLPAAPTDLVFDDLTLIDVATARQLFDLVLSRSCRPFDPNAGCIPFLYPDDGCESRAHEMCRLMKAENVIAGKIWIYADADEDDTFFLAPTPNHPDCEVPWGHHTAPVVRIGAKTLRVIDPSLVSEPVSPSEWRRVQFPPGDLRFSDAGVYDRPRPHKFVFDRTFEKTQARLRHFRWELRLRAVRQRAAPPYAHCRT